MLLLKCPKTFDHDCLKNKIYDLNCLNCIVLYTMKFRDRKVISLSHFTVLTSPTWTMHEVLVIQLYKYLLYIKFNSFIYVYNNCINFL